MSRACHARADLLVHSATITTGSSAVVDSARDSQARPPWSEALVRRSRFSVAGTLAALASRLMTGEREPGRRHSSRIPRPRRRLLRVERHRRGICLLRSEGLIRRAPSSIAMFIKATAPPLYLSMTRRPLRYRFTARELSAGQTAKHARCRPPDGTEDEEYLSSLSLTSRRARPISPDIVFYQSGVDPYHEIDWAGRAHP